MPALVGQAYMFADSGELPAKILCIMISCFHACLYICFSKWAIHFKVFMFYLNEKTFRAFFFISSFLLCAKCCLPIFRVPRWTDWTFQPFSIFCDRITFPIFITALVWFIISPLSLALSCSLSKYVVDRPVVYFIMFVYCRTQTVSLFFKLCCSKRLCSCVAYLTVTTGLFAKGNVWCFLSTFIMCYALNDAMWLPKL